MLNVIYTVQMNNVRTAEMADIPAVDITVKSGLKAFAPTWEMVWGFKTGDLSETRYTEQYQQMMTLSQTQHPQAWQRLLALPAVALICYCRPGKFCHRHLLKAELIRLHHQAGDDAVDGGELLPEGM